jgi:hypothetical protein
MPAMKTAGLTLDHFTLWFRRNGLALLLHGALLLLFLFSYHLAWGSTSLSRMLKRYPGVRTWQAAPWATFLRMWDLDCTEYHEHGGDPAPFIPISPDSSPPSSPSLLSDSSLRNPILSPPPSPRKSQAKLTKDDLAFLASFRPRPGPMSPQRLKQQFERVLGPSSVLVCPSSQSTSLEEEQATVEATLRVGGRLRTESRPREDVEHPQKPQTPPRTLQTRCGESSHEAAGSPRALGHPQPRHVGESFDGTMYVVSGQNCIFKDR